MNKNVIQLDKCMCISVKVKTNIGIYRNINIAIHRTYIYIYIKREGGTFICLYINMHVHMDTLLYLCKQIKNIQ